MNIFLIGMPGGTEWLLIVVAVLLLFGARKVPEFMRGLGKGIKEFNDAKGGNKEKEEDKSQDKDRK